MLGTHNVIVSELSDEEAREMLRDIDAQRNAQPVQPDADYEKAEQAYRRMRLAQIDGQLIEVVRRTRELTELTSSLLADVLALNTRVRTTLQELTE